MKQTLLSRYLLIFFGCFLWSTLGSACGDTDTPGCQVDDDCRAGRVCVASICQDQGGETSAETGGTSVETGGTSTGATGVDAGDEDTGEPDVIDEPDVVEDTDEPDIVEDTDEPDVIEDIDEPDTEPDIVEDTGEPDVIEDTDEPDVIEDTDEPDVEPDIIEDTGGPDVEPDVIDDTDEPDAEPDVIEDTDEPDAEPDVIEDADEPDAEPDVIEDTGGPDVEEDVSEPDVVEDTSPDIEEDTGPELLDGIHLAVEPGSIDFGEVGLFVSEFQEVVLTNIGTEPVNIDSVRLESEPSQGFQLIPPTDVPAVLNSRESATWRVRFRPTVVQGDGPTNYGNAVLVDSNDEDEPSVRIQITGSAIADPEECLSFTRNVVDFGFVAPGNVDAETIELVNCGESDLEVSSVAFVDSVPGLSVTSGVQFPATIEADGRLSFALTYAPANADSVQASLVAEGGGGVVAEALVRAGAECPTAETIGSIDGGQATRSDLEGFVGQVFTFSGVLSEDPADGDLIYTWTVDGPEGSVALSIDPDLQSEVFSFVPDVAGLYEVTLSVRSEASGLDACEVNVTSVRAVDEDAAVDISVSWSNFADLDLHVLRSGEDGEFGEFGSSQNVVADDVYFGNPRPDFGVLGDVADDPWFQGDDRDGFGPERTLLPVLEDGRRYKVGVNFAARNFAPRANATLTLIVGGEEFTSERAWNETGVYWIPVILEGDGSITEVDELE